MGRWAFICDKTRATDNDPRYKDEQRAWYYDTIRDFLPELTGDLKPTVRLYSEEMQWCSLNPNNPDDIEKFKNIIEGRRKELNGVKYFMCVCYDIYGIRHLNLPNPDVDVVLNLVHCFYPVGEGPAGTTFFTKHGFAGASKQWRCPVFGTAVFFNCDTYENWPTGVYWNRGDISTLNWRYAYNPLKSGDKFEINVKEGVALVRIYVL